MNFDAAILTEQGVTFVVVIVKEEILENDFSINEARQLFSGFFPMMPVILMAQNRRQEPIYNGREDLVKFLQKIDYMRLPFQQYTVK